MRAQTLTNETRARRRGTVVFFFFVLRSAFGDVVFQPVYTTASLPSYSQFPGLTEGNDGNFYGMRFESQSLQTNCVLFRVTPGGTFTKLATINGERPANPLNSALLLAKDGNFYGTTPYGGTFQSGSMIRYNGSAVSRLFSFDGSTAGVPNFSLIEASDGFLYGVATKPAAIYRATTNGTVTVLTNFPAYNWPIDGLVEGPDGWLYGATYFSTGGGGAEPPFHENGRVYKFSASEGFKTVKLFFGDVRAKASPISGHDGFLYGPAGPDNYPTTNYGSIYRMTTDGMTTDISTFHFSDGWTPFTRLLLASDGNFYGICSGGGAFGYGTIFRISSAETLTILVHLSGTNGLATPSGMDVGVPLIEARNRIVYGAISCLLHPTPATAQRVIRLVEPPIVRCEASLGKPTSISWNSFSGGVYQVSYKPRVDSTDWVTLYPSLTATSQVSSCFDDMAGAHHRFYRVALLP